jgi:hypothetical protein
VYYSLQLFASLLSFLFNTHQKPTNKRHRSVTTEDGLDLAEDTPRCVLLSGVFTGVGCSRRSGRSVSMLIGDARGSVLAASQASLGVRVRVSTASRSSRAVVKVARDSVSRDAGVLVSVRSDTGDTG